MFTISLTIFIYGSNLRLRGWCCWTEQVTSNNLNGVTVWLKGSWRGGGFYEETSTRLGKCKPDTRAGTSRKSTDWWGDTYNFPNSRGIPSARKVMTYTVWEGARGDSGIYKNSYFGYIGMKDRDESREFKSWDSSSRRITSKWFFRKDSCLI